MTNRINRSSCASYAIAASLALCSTPLLAQEVSQAAPPAAAAEPAPVVVLPAPPAAAPPAATVQPVPTAPVEAPAAAAANDAPAPARAVQSARTATRRTTAPRVVREATAVAAPAAAATKSVSTAPPRVTPATSPITPSQDIAQPAPAQQPQAGQPSDNGSLLGLGALAAVSIVGLGAFAARRRRRIVTDDDAPAVLESSGTDEIVETPGVVAEPDYATYELAEQESARVTPASGVQVPDGPVPTGEARQRLIDRMVAAAPDAANPFTSVKGRRRRARLILQARENEQQQAGNDGFDWRSFPTRPQRTEPVADRTTVDA